MAGKKSKKAYDDVYEVDKIVDERLLNGTKQYKIHWKGYGKQEDTWEPETSLIDCESIVQEFRNTKASASPEGRMAYPQWETPPAYDEELLTPRRQTRRSLTRRSTSARGLPRDNSPSRYNLRKTTIEQRMGIPSYLTTDERGTSKSPLGFGFERRSIRFTEQVEIQELVGERDPLTSVPVEMTERDEQTDTVAGAETPSWMQLGCAELVFCLFILVVIAVAIWYLSTSKFIPSTTSSS